MSMWPDMTETQNINFVVGEEMARKYDPIIWEQMEVAIREAFFERAKRLQRGTEVSEYVAEMFLEEEIFLVMPIIKRFFQQR